MKKALSMLLCALLGVALLLPAQALIPEIVGMIIWDELTEPFGTADPTQAPTPEPTPSLSERIGVGVEQIRIPTSTPSAFITPGPININPSFTLPTAKPPSGSPGQPAQPAPKPASPTAKPAAPAAKPTPRPQGGNARTPAGKGAELTSFGLYFEELRPKLTDTWYMFTPLDLSNDSVLSYPLVANNQSIVGSVRVTVRAGQLFIECLPVEGVNLGREFYTLFPNLDAIQTLNVNLLEAQGYRFNEPIDIQQTFGSDRKVILYVNNTADYKANLRGVTAFVPEQHRLFMQNLMPLLD